MNCLVLKLYWVFCI